MGQNRHATDLQRDAPEDLREEAPAPDGTKTALMSAVGLMTESRFPARARRQVELVRVSALRQLKARYRGTTLGVLWSFANPLLMTALYTLIFGTAFASYYNGSTSRYVFSAFVGVVVVTFFTQSTSEALGTVVANGGLLNKISLDPETFPIAAIAANAYQQALTTFPLILILSAALTHDPRRIALVPVVLCGIVALCAGAGLALAALYVFFRDLSYLWGVAAFVIWMTCPVFYPAALVPVAVRPFLSVNPVGLGIGALREVTLGIGPIDYGAIAGFLFAALVSVAVGHALFRTLRHEFMNLL
jgi:homopolymeric O-antigen transport system permease protein